MTIPLFGQSGLPSSSPSSSASASATPIIDGEVADAATNNIYCVDANPVCVWIEQTTGNALIANWVGTVAPVVLKVILVLFATWVLTRLAKRIIIGVFERVMNTRINPFEKLDITASSPVVSDAAKRKRARTLGHIVGSVVTIAAWTVAILMVLAQLGFNVAPLIASAGIAGIAIGFGAQSLVKDYITGLFLIIEGQYAVGDWIAIDQAEGEVESITLRVTRLRDSNGTVWFVPNGQITLVANSTKHWAQAVIDLPLSPSVPFIQVEELVSKATKQFLANGQYQDDLVGDPEFLGVLRVDRYGPVYRITIKTQPGQQWKIKRMYQVELKRVFDQAGVSMTLDHSVPFSSEVDPS